MTSTAWLVPLRRPSHESLEHYLEQQAADGRHLAGVDLLSPLRLRFIDAPPAQVRYVVERRAQPAPVDYFSFREDLGWEHVGRVGDRHFWRREYDGERPEGFIANRRGALDWVS
ncbi:hypothetical protein GOHSU_23_00340 [Gordonia hirsuta DSM 44140 = NBRC 16056]|uniref:Uncharacterized protein n=1 Tax=Gordonia hirsuta DSM 44140 = NBRC 16056 TaxID=1121927 RepID=L7LCC3_9ACTN|nr:DUF2812 domain-containing protein [Gordonia hirsuta]GAC57688.1 hypothetical protein GOHSU_23_00340 [Gordonia hirsuta DSM 44140 = NBRC 16056]